MPSNSNNTAVAERETTTVVERASSLAHQMLRDSESVIEAAEVILRNIDNPEYRFDPSELVILRAAGVRTDPNGLKIQIATRMRVREEKRKAGTPAAYAAAKQSHADAMAAEAKNREKLEEQIRTLEAKLSAFADATETSRQTVESMDNARNYLRQDGALPQYIVDRMGLASQSVSPYHTDLVSAETKLDTIDYLLSMNDVHANGVQESLVNYAAGHGHEHLLTRRHASAPHEVSQVAWDEHCDELRAQRPKIVAALDKAKVQHESAVAERETLRNYHINDL